MRLIPNIAQGECSAPFSAGGVTARVVRYRPGLTLAMHAHESSSIAVVICGGFEEESPSAVRRASLGDCVIKPARARHANRFAPQWTQTLQLEIVESSLCEPLSDRLAGAADRPIRCADRALLRAMLGLYCALRNAGGAGNALENHLIDALGAAAATLSRPTAAAPAWLKRAEDLLDSRVEETIRVTQIAADVAVHPVHLARVFRGVHGCSVMGYARRLRVRRAASLAAQTRRPLAQVALDCGFYDQSHLARDFRREFGVTPLQYRHGVG